MYCTKKKPPGILIGMALTHIYTGSDQRVATQQNNKALNHHT